MILPDQIIRDLILHIVTSPILCILPSLILYVLSSLILCVSPPILARCPDQLLSPPSQPSIPASAYAFPIEPATEAPLPSWSHLGFFCTLDPTQSANRTMPDPSVFTDRSNSLSGHASFSGYRLFIPTARFHLPPLSSSSPFGFIFHHSVLHHHSVSSFTTWLFIIPTAWFHLPPLGSSFHRSVS
ncbi:hypothetical protein LR48_Vigan205s007400 [Vigna angularis]|uniref:Uncharacterized protein n=1 Tax=Phaseolus angularis TaxID=3914 RepID=A0A0L9T5S4_PHAAN|nr:hypothetical protein LR48_Vigan205s007400 [Vigna angularis]